MQRGLVLRTLTPFINILAALLLALKENTAYMRTSWGVRGICGTEQLLIRVRSS